MRRSHEDAYYGLSFWDVCGAVLWGQQDPGPVPETRSLLYRGETMKVSRKCRLATKPWGGSPALLCHLPAVSCQTKIPSSLPFLLHTHTLSLFAGWLFRPVIFLPLHCSELTHLQPAFGACFLFIIPYLVTHYLF